VAVPSPGIVSAQREQVQMSSIVERTTIPLIRCVACWYGFVILLGCSALQRQRGSCTTHSAAPSAVIRLRNPISTMRPHPLSGGHLAILNQLALRSG
jgi:hypothetical protein